MLLMVTSNQGVTLTVSSFLRLEETDLFLSYRGKGVTDANVALTKIQCTLNKALAIGGDSGSASSSSCSDSDLELKIRSW